jgi:hypothetical protein
LIAQARRVQEEDVVGTFFSQPDISDQLNEVDGHVENCYLSQIVNIQDMAVNENLVIGNRNWVDLVTEEYIIYSFGYLQCQ